MTCIEERMLFNYSFGQLKKKPTMSSNTYTFIYYNHAQKKITLEDLAVFVQNKILLYYFYIFNSMNTSTLNDILNINVDDIFDDDIFDDDIFDDDILDDDIFYYEKDVQDKNDNSHHENDYMSDDDDDDHDDDHDENNYLYQNDDLNRRKKPNHYSSMFTYSYFYLNQRPCFSSSTYTFMYHLATRRYYDYYVNDHFLPLTRRNAFINR